LERPENDNTEAVARRTARASAKVTDFCNRLVIFGK
jgi:hypothetical protein